MNQKLQKTLSIEEILKTIEASTLNESCTILYKQIGSMVRVSGTVQKKITRHQHLKLLIRPDETPSDKTFDVFAEFDEKEAKKLHDAKIRKGSKIKLSGSFFTSGTMAICLNHCKLRGEK